MINHRFKKRYGQNFLIVEKYASDLVKALDAKDGDTIIEIGPGDGTVTNILLNSFNSKIYSIEIDYDLLPKLIKRFSDRFSNFNLIHNDFLALDLNTFFAEKNIKGDVHFIGSLPYNISKKIIKKILEFYSNDVRITTSAFIVQEEVAKDYTARAPKATFLSNFTNVYANSRKLISIPARKFYPVPNVNGAILRFEPNDQFINLNKENFIKLIKIGFKSPRKKVINNLNNIPEFKSKEISKIFKNLNIDPNKRASELELNEWLKIFKELEI